MSRKWIIPSRKLTAAQKPNARIFLPKHGLRGLANECVTLQLKITFDLAVDILALVPSGLDNGQLHQTFNGLEVGQEGGICSGH